MTRIEFCGKSCSHLLDLLAVTEPGNWDSKVLLPGLVCDSTLRQNQLLVSKSPTVQSSCQELFLKLWEEKQKLHEDETLDLQV